MSRLRADRGACGGAAAILVQPRAVESTSVTSRASTHSNASVIEPALSAHGTPLPVPYTLDKSGRYDALTRGSWRFARPDF